MARVSTYLNFNRLTETAFLFYKSVFGTEFSMPIARFKDTPPQPDQPPLAEADKNLVMHVELPILAGHVLMGTDAPESMGFTITPGNNIYINLEPDTRGETDRLFEALSKGGKIDMPLQEMFWGGYFGTLIDQFGIRWMFNCSSKRGPSVPRNDQQDSTKKRKESMQTDIQRITPFLWFDRQAHDAASFYTAIFNNSGIICTTYYGKEGAEVSGR